MKFVVNRRYGGFHLSDEAMAKLAQLGIDLNDLAQLPRCDSRLVQLVEQLGTQASDRRYSNLVVIDVPDEVAKGRGVYIQSHDGYEIIHENHQEW